MPLENIFVCGSILADTEILKNGCGHGLALATAHVAAKSCMEYIR
jgi:anaerobic glycerol-3-phosphate dehydrogenase